MDIECPTCAEPWEVEHMRHDEPHEWGLSEEDVDGLLQTGAFSGAADPRRQAAKAAGWEFAGNSLLSFVRCPNCKHAPATVPSFAGLIAAERRQAVALVAELLDGDEDGMAAILQDLPAMLAAAA